MPGCLLRLAKDPLSGRFNQFGQLIGEGCVACRGINRPRPDLGQPSKPRGLPLGELARPGLYSRDRLGKREFAFQQLDDLAIANRLGGHRAERPGSGHQAPHFLYQSGLEHRRDAPVDSLVQLGARPLECDHRGFEGGGAIVLGL